MFAEQQRPVRDIVHDWDDADDDDSFRCNQEEP